MAGSAIHQIVSYWAEAEDSLLRVRGVGPVHSSFDLALLATWWPYLARYSQLNQQDAPAGSLVYLSVQTSDGADWAMVVRRVPALDPGKTRINTLSHALVGSSDVLTPTQALRMMWWPFWFGFGWGGQLRLASEQVEPSFVSKVLSLGDLASRDDEQFAVVQPQYRAATVRLLAETLRHPDQPFVVASTQLPEPDRVLYTVVDVLSAPLAAVPGVSWTFSTFDDEEAPPEGPRFSFVKQRGRSSYQSARVPVELSSPPAAPDHAEGFAEDLLSFYEDEGSEQLGDFLATAQPPRTATEVTSWAGVLAPRLAAFHATELRLLRDALSSGRRLGDGLPPGHDPSWMRMLPRQLDALDQADFARFLLRWQGLPSMLAGGIRLPASELVPTDVLAALGRQAAQAVFRSALGRDTHGEQLALAALVECQWLPNEVFGELGPWWTAASVSELDELDDRMRVLDAAVRASMTAIKIGFTTIAEFDRQLAADTCGHVLRDVPSPLLVQRLPDPTDGSDLMHLLLQVLAARSAKMSRNDRRQVLVFLSRPDVQFLAAKLATLPPPDQGAVRRRLVEIGFGGDVIRDKGTVERVGIWIRNGTMDDELALVLQDEADEQGAATMVATIAITHSDQIRANRGHRQLRTSAAGDTKTGPPPPPPPPPPPLKLKQKQKLKQKTNQEQPDLPPLAERRSGVLRGATQRLFGRGTPDGWPLPLLAFVLVSLVVMGYVIVTKLPWGILP